MSDKCKEYKFICMGKECMQQGQFPCMISFFSDCEPDFPSYCPYEFEPNEDKYKHWMLVKE